MTPKELVQKGYESFAVGDMATIKSLFHEQAVIKVNGMHKFSGTYHGPDSFINDFLAHIPSHFENFKFSIFGRKMKHIKLINSNISSDKWYNKKYIEFKTYNTRTRIIYHKNIRQH